MKLLISTMLRLIYYDGQPHTVLRGDLARGEAHYDGITWSQDDLYVSGARDFRYGIYVLDPSTFAIRDIIFGELHEIHQIIWKNDLLYVTNTGKNRIEVWDGQKWSWVTYRPSSCDIDHLNGIWTDGQNFFVSEFRHKTSPPSVVRVAEMDLSLIKTVKMGDPIHNVYKEDETFYMLVSQEPAGFCTYNRNLGRIPLPQAQGMLLRGLARSKSNWFIGASRWETDRDKRHVGDALIFVLDNEFREVDRIMVKDAGPVCEVRVIEPEDLAHNGVRYPKRIIEV